MASDSLTRQLAKLDRAAVRREAARRELDTARMELLTALRAAKEAGASYRKLAERLGVAPTEVVRLLSKADGGEGGSR